MDEVRRRIEAIRTDRTQGASALAREAILTLRLAAGLGGPPDVFRGRLEEVSAELQGARPAMAAIKNAVGQFLREWRGGGSVQAQDLCNSLLARLEEATERVVELGAGLVRNGTTVLTASYSSAVVRALARASGRGRRVALLAAEPSGAPISYAGLVREALAPWGIPVRAVGESAIAGAVGAAELVLVGADKLLPDGSLVNGAPTLAVAQAAHRRIPLYSLCESFKLDTDPATEPGFDLVPPELVTGFVTERGVLSPAQVRELF